MLQIDVKDKLESGMVRCSLYTGERCVTIFMSEWEYLELIRDGFFVRNGKERDSANVLNTTHEYERIK